MSKDRHFVRACPLIMEHVRSCVCTHMSGREILSAHVRSTTTHDHSIALTTLCLFIDPCIVHNERIFCPRMSAPLPLMTSQRTHLHARGVNVRHELAEHAREHCHYPTPPCLKILSHVSLVLCLLNSHVHA